MKITDLLTEKHIKQILSQYGDADLVSSSVQPASEGMAGFLGDHFRVSLVVRTGGADTELRLFAKTAPLHNPARALHVQSGGYFKREVLMYRLLDHMQPDQGPNPWSVRALVKEDGLIVMLDATAAGYRTCAPIPALDAAHALLAAAALARYHAALACHDTSQLRRDRSYSAGTRHADLLTEPTFRDTPWLRAAAKLTADFLETFSTEYAPVADGLELALAELNVEACETLTEYEDTLNVLIHKDLWINNVMFRYESGAPVNAIILDFQLVRYAPPAFDVLVFLYYCTSREFRACRERDVLEHYYAVFAASVDAATRARLRRLRYDRAAFFLWCERARLFGVMEAAACGPQVWLAAAAAARLFDDAASFQRLQHEDRSPLLQHARRCPAYRAALLEIFDEYVNRHLVHTPTGWQRLSN